MADEEYRQIFQKKLSFYMNLYHKNQTDLMHDLGISSATISSWCTGKKLPRMDKIQMLADYFNIEKSDLIEDKQDEEQYYLNPETAKIAQEISDNEELSLLFDAARNAEPEDLQMVHNMLLRMKRAEKGDES